MNSKLVGRAIPPSRDYTCTLCTIAMLAQISPSRVGQHIDCKMHMCVCLCVRLCVSALVFTLGFAARDQEWAEGSLDVEAVQDEHALKDPLEVESCAGEAKGNCSSPFRKFEMTNVCSWCVEPVNRKFTVKCVKEDYFRNKLCPPRCLHAGFNCLEDPPKTVEWERQEHGCSYLYNTCRVVGYGGHVVDKTS